MPNIIAHVLKQVTLEDNFLFIKFLLLKQVCKSEEENVFFNSLEVREERWQKRMKMIQICMMMRLTLFTNRKKR